MWEEILKAIPVYFSSMLKFIFGPVGGYAAGLNLITTILVTIGGMMTVVILFAFFGDFMRTKVLDRFFPNRKRFTAHNRRVVGIWKKYGLIGVATLTPILLTPIGGAILAVSVGTPRNKLILYMLISASVWAVIFSVGIYYFGNSLFPGYIK
jgi:hypothetical protein